MPGVQKWSSLGLHVSPMWWLKVRHGWSQELGLGRESPCDPRGDLEMKVAPGAWLESCFEVQPGLQVSQGLQQ